jgi:S1-C subfamily serine protease
MKTLRGLLLGVCLVLSVHPTQAANKKHEKALNSTFVLYGRSVGQHVDHHALCTAFVYKKASDGYFLLTAGHCFTAGAPADATYLVAEGQVKDNPTLQPVEVLNHVDRADMDVAELHLKTTKKYEILELDKNPAKIDDKVFYVGYPEIVAQAVYTGRVSSNIIESVGPDPNEPCDLCKGRFMIQTGGGGGASGSPIISEHTGKVVGILEGHLFENGVVVVPAPAIEVYYEKEGHSKNAQSGEKIE